MACPLARDPSRYDAPSRICPARRRALRGGTRGSPPCTQHTLLLPNWYGCTFEESSIIQSALDHEPHRVCMDTCASIHRAYASELTAQIAASHWLHSDALCRRRLKWNLMRVFDSSPCSVYSKVS